MVTLVPYGLSMSISLLSTVLLVVPITVLKYGGTYW